MVIWQMTKSSMILSKMCLVELKWVFKKNKYIQFRVNLVSGRYTKIPGVGYTASYSPLVSYTTLNIVLLMWIINKWDYQVIYVEATFIYANL